jgi:hypothetical protein
MRNRASISGYLQFFLLAILAGSLTFNSLAQEETGTIAGTITDATGGTLPGVEITITNLKTATARTYTTDDTGDYIVRLYPSTYAVKASLQGFKDFDKKEIILKASENARLDIRLEIGLPPGGCPVITIEDPPVSMDPLGRCFVDIDKINASRMSRLSLTDRLTAES